MSDLSSKDYLNSLNESQGDRESVVNEGIQNLKNTIRSVKVEPPKPDKVGSDVTPMRKLDKLDLANQAINTYKERIKPAKDTTKDHVEDIKSNEKPVTKAQRVNAKEIARQLSSMRKHTVGSGNVGKQSPTTANGNGNVGTSTPSYAGLVSSMTLEEYQAHIFGSFGLTDDEPREEEVVVEEYEDEDVVDVVAILEEALLALESDDWIAVDKATRVVCSENNILPKELNSEFRRRHGSYPDKWIKEQVEVEYCGYFPLEEAARINKVGQLYHVTFAYRGGTQRFQFFWPEAGRPSHEEMQSAVEKFYPRARLLSYYLAPKQDHNGGLVLVPPMTESYEILEESDWNVMSGYDQETLDLIYEEEGEPLDTVEMLDDGSYVAIVEDYDTGNVNIIHFGENKSGDDSLHDWFNKSQSSDGTKGWVQIGGPYAGKPCAKQEGQKSKPKCGSSKMKRNLSDKEEDRAFNRKNREDGDADRSGKAKNVRTEETKKDACYSKVKSRYKVWPSAYASGALVKCRKKGAANWGNKKEEVEYTAEGAAWTRKEGQNSAGGLNEKGRKSYERENPGSDLKRPQPEGGKRRDSYCARSKGQQKMHNIDCSKDPDKRICKARRKWNCL